jgi:hypothetical protein
MKKLFVKIPIKDKKVLVICSGHNLKIYKEDIKKYIKNNKGKLVTIGCKNIFSIFSTDYCIWGDPKGFIRFRRKMDKNAIPIFPSDFPIDIIKKYWHSYYETYTVISSSYDKTTEGFDNIEFECKRRGVIYGRFKTTGCHAIFLAFCNGAKEITIAGMDGYGFYSKEQLKEGEINGLIGQHCYGKGFTNFKNRPKKGATIRGKNKQEIYDNFVYNDIIVNKVLFAMKKHGVNFKIITPTVFKDFYDPKILNINE